MTDHPTDPPESESRFQRDDDAWTATAQSPLRISSMEGILMTTDHPTDPTLGTCEADKWHASIGGMSSAPHHRHPTECINWRPIPDRPTDSTDEPTPLQDSERYWGNSYDYGWYGEFVGSFAKADRFNKFTQMEREALAHIAAETVTAVQKRECDAVMNLRPGIRLQCSENRGHPGRHNDLGDLSW